MAQPVTECATIVLKPGADIEGHTQEAKIWKETLKTVSEQDGYQREYYGRQLENPDILMLLIDWTSLSAHQKFMSSPEYTPFKENLSSIMESVSLHHITPTPFPPTILARAPCTEVATFFNATPNFMSNAAKFMEAVEGGNVDGYLGHAYGEVVEELAKGDGSERGSAVKLFIGWETMGHHMRFRETELFKQNVVWLREGNGGAEMFHVPFRAGQGGYDLLDFKQNAQGGSE